MMLLTNKQLRTAVLDADPRDALLEALYRRVRLVLTNSARGPTTRADTRHSSRCQLPVRDVDDVADIDRLLRHRARRRRLDVANVADIDHRAQRRVGVVGQMGGYPVRSGQHAVSVGRRRRTGPQPDLELAAVLVGLDHRRCQRGGYHLWVAGAGEPAEPEVVAVMDETDGDDFAVVIWDVDRIDEGTFAAVVPVCNRVRVADGSPRRRVRRRLHR